MSKKKKKNGILRAAEGVTDFLVTFCYPLWSIITEQTHGNVKSIYMMKKQIVISHEVINASVLQYK